MKRNYTTIVTLLDRSGSMKKIRQDVIGGFNSFLDSQKKVKGEATVSLYQFDDRFQTDYEFVDINFVKPLDSSNFVPRGWTALYDAVGKTIVSVGEKLALLRENERPSKVIFLIITDGEENWSKEYKSADSIRSMIKHQTNKYNWEFVYIGANQDVIFNARKIGIPVYNTIDYDDNPIGVRSMYATLSANVTKSRLGNKVDYSKEEE